MSVKTDIKNFGSCLSVDKAHPWGWQNYKKEQKNNTIKIINFVLWTENNYSINKLSYQIN